MAHHEIIGSQIQTHNRFIDLVFFIINSQQPGADSSAPYFLEAG